MEANELRKGNIVVWKGETAVVSQIWEKEVVFKCGDIGLLEDVEPKELTKELLEKLGVSEEWTKGGFLRWTKGKFKLLDRRLPIPQFHLPNAIIKYAHQLQNLYFVLSGEELTFSI